MTEVGNVYGGALYSLAKEEACSEAILAELKLLDDCFVQEPDFLLLLSAPNLSKAERCRILDDSFRGKLQPYVLNFMKILTEKGYMRHFHDCVAAYRGQYNQDNGILPVTAVTAVPMRGDQKTRLMDKLHQITGQRIELLNRIDPSVLGGMRLDYDGKRMDDTVSQRLDTIGRMLKNTVL